MSAVAILPLSPLDVHRICSGQVILDLATAVKELIENSLDAHATAIEVRLKHYGAELIEVVDNGSGISPSNHHAVALKHYTSKLSAFSDLAHVRSFGFRGEALSSLCALGKMIISTRTQEEQLGTQLRFDTQGKCIHTKHIARNVGTTVTITELFHSLPVRHKAFMKNIKREFASMLSVVQSYALISAGVRFSVHHQSKGNNRQLMFSTQGSSDIRDLVTNIFGARQTQALDTFDHVIQPDDHDPEHVLPPHDAGEYRVSGLISQLAVGCGRSSNDRQYVFINHRPVDLPKLHKLINDTYRSFNAASSYPVFILNLLISTTAYDVNVTPNKRTVMIHSEAALLQCIKAELTRRWSPAQYTFAVKSIEHFLPHRAKTEDDDLPATPVPELELPTQDDTRETEHTSNGNASESDVDHTRPSHLLPATVAKLPSFSHQHQQRVYASQHSSSQLLNLEQFKKPAVPAVPTVKLEPGSAVVSSSSSAVLSTTTASVTPVFTHSPMRVQKRPREPAVLATASLSFASKSHRSALLAVVSTTAPATVTSIPTDDDDTVADQSERPSEEHKQMDVTNRDTAPATYPFPPPGSRCISIDVNAIVQHWNKKVSLAETEPIDSNPHSLRQRLAEEDAQQPITIGESDDDDFSASPPSSLGGAGTVAAVFPPALLARVVHQPDFLSMRIIGQFNFGFIITALNSDLFIIDQHASDEKYRYEHLLQSQWRIQTQPLIQTIPLPLTPTQQMQLHEYLPIFTANGFEFEFDDEDEEEDSRRVVGLKSVPCSKNVTFGVSDVLELLALLLDHPPPATITTSLSSFASLSHYRLPKFQSLFASRACRSAVMIGDALDTNKMKQIVNHMSEMEHPWACPHGRPTMRHLFDLSLLQQTHTDPKTQSTISLSNGVVDVSVTDNS